MGSFKGEPVGKPWSRWNSGQGSSPGKRFTVTGASKGLRGTAKPADKKPSGNKK